MVTRKKYVERLKIREEEEEEEAKKSSLRVKNKKLKNLVYKKSIPKGRKQEGQVGSDLDE